MNEQREIMSWKNAKTGAESPVLKLKKGESFEDGIDRMSELGWVIDPPAIVTGLDDMGIRHLIHPRNLEKHAQKLIPLTALMEESKDDERDDKEDNGRDSEGNQSSEES